jgi:putative hemolysin
VISNILPELLVLISLSGILSASEIALFSLSRMQLKQIRDQAPAQFRRIKKMIQDPLGLLITILVCNEIVNILLGSLITEHFVEGQQAPEWFLNLGMPNWFYQSALGVLITTPIVLIFCELTPKVMASRMNRLIVAMFSAPISVVYSTFTPIHRLLKSLLPTNQKKITDTKSTGLQEDDLVDFIEQQSQAGHLHDTELQLIKNVFTLDDVFAETLAIPIRKIRTLPDRMTLNEATKIILGNQIITRIPLFGAHKEDITGVLDVKDLLQMKLDDDIGKDLLSTISSEPLFTSPKTDLETLFKKMRSRKTYIAFLRTESGRCTGMITMQDILDYLIEEVFEEK